MGIEFDFDRQEHKQKRIHVFFCVIRWIVALAAAVFAARLITDHALELTNMTDQSMSETLQADDTILINKLSYLRSGPERFDVIVFKKDGKEHSFYGISRVIGLPGETVSIADGYVYINGNYLYEPMIGSLALKEGLAREGVTLEEDEYFVLGDNRLECHDSRSADIGNVSRSEIIGEAWIRTNNFSVISKINAQEDNKEE